MKKHNTDSAEHSSDVLGDLLGAMKNIERGQQEIREILAGRTKPFHTVEEVAELTGRSDYTVRRWISENRISATRIEGTGPRGRLLVPRGELDKLIATGLGENIPAIVNTERSNR